MSAAFVTPLLRSKRLGWQREVGMMLGLLGIMTIVDFFWMHYLFGG